MTAGELVFGGALAAAVEALVEAGDASFAGAGDASFADAGEAILAGVLWRCASSLARSSSARRWFSAFLSANACCGGATSGGRCSAAAWAGGTCQGQ